MKTLIWIGYFLKYTLLSMLLMNLAIHFVCLLIAFVKMENVFYEMWVTEYTETITTLRAVSLIAIVIGLLGGTHDTKLYFRKKEKNVNTEN